MTTLPRKPFDKSQFWLRTVLLLLSAVTFYTLLQLSTPNLNQKLALMADNFRLMFSESHFKHLTIAEGLYSITITLSLAIQTTLIGAIGALFLGLFASQNLAPHWLTSIIKNFVALVRAIPTVLWVLIFAVSAGLGSTAAVIGMTFHTVSYLTKSYSESFEEIEPGVLEALRSCGASWWQIVFQAVIPTSMHPILSWTFIRFEINFLNAVAMGAAAGAGGIGFDLFMAGGHYLDFREVGMITYLIIVVSMILESTSIQLKKRLDL